MNSTGWYSFVFYLSASSPRGPPQYVTVVYWTAPMHQNILIQLSPLPPISGVEIVDRKSTPICVRLMCDTVWIDPRFGAFSRSITIKRSWHSRREQMLSKLTHHEMFRPFCCFSSHLGKNIRMKGKKHTTRPEMSGCRHWKTGRVDRWGLRCRLLWLFKQTFQRDNWEKNPC